MGMREKDDEGHSVSYKRRAMLILALDSSSSFCAVGVWQDGQVVAQAREPMERGQDARLLPMIVDVMAQAGCGYPDLDKVAVMRGPGSFTGVRVGLAAARGLGLAAGKPVIGIDNFSIYQSLGASAGRNLLVVINSKRAELFCRYYPCGDAAHEACLMTQEEIQAFIAAHPDTDIVGDKEEPEALAVCALLAASIEAGNPAFLPRPLYVRAPDVTFAAASSR